MGRALVETVGLDIRECVDFQCSSLRDNEPPRKLFTVLRISRGVTKYRLYNIVQFLCKGANKLDKKIGLLGSSSPRESLSYSLTEWPAEIKVGRVFRIVISSEFRMGQYIDDGHREDAPALKNHVVKYWPIEQRNRVTEGGGGEPGHLKICRSSKVFPSEFIRTRT